MKLIKFKLLSNLNIGFFEWVLDDILFDFQSLPDKNIGSLKFLLKNKLNCPFLFFFELETAITIEKLNFNCQWVLFDYFLMKWIQKYDFSNHFHRYQVENSLQKRNYILISKDFRDEMTLSDLDSLENFVEKICYILNNFHVMIRKTTGFSWAFIGNIQNYTTRNLLILNHLKQHLKEKENFRKELSLYTENFPIKRKCSTFNKSSFSSPLNSGKNNVKEVESLENKEKKYFHENNQMNSNSSLKILEAPQFHTAKITSIDLLANEEYDIKESIKELDSHEEIREKLVEIKRRSSLFKRDNAKGQEIGHLYGSGHEKKEMSAPLRILINRLRTENFEEKYFTSKDLQNVTTENLTRKIFRNKTTTESLLRRKSSVKKQTNINKEQDKNSKEKQNIIFQEKEPNRKTLKWKELHLRGVNSVIFPNIKAIKHSFSEMYFYIFTNK